MIPRIKPYLGREELSAAFSRQRDAVNRFEEAFARTFGAGHAIAFPYGRSAQWAFFKAMGLKGAEVIMPAYTCVVVAHATVLSDNIPRFVDISLYDYNMDLDQVEKAVNERTRAIVATHLFGYPLDIYRLQEIVRTAEARWGHKIWVIQDCAHGFGCCRQGKPVCNEEDIALFGLNISKMITSIFGGMITTMDTDLYAKLRAFRDEYFAQPSLLKRLRRLLYLLAVYPAYNQRIYGLVHLLQEETPLLDHLTKAYHLDGIIHFPPDYLDQMIGIEARVGSAQLRKYPEIIRRRRENTQYYDQHLREVDGLTLPPLVQGATYSHYVVLVRNRNNWLKSLQRAGIELGQVIDYVVPEMTPYRMYATERYPNSHLAMECAINLPVHAGLKAQERRHIVEAMKHSAKKLTRSKT